MIETVWARVAGVEAAAAALIAAYANPEMPATARAAAGAALARAVQERMAEMEAERLRRELFE